MNSQFKTPDTLSKPPVQSSRLKRLLIPVIILLACAATIYLLKSSAKPPAKAQKEEKTWPVEIQAVQSATEITQVTLLGTVESPYSSTLSSAVAADVIATPTLEGAVVKKGDLLIQLGDHELQLLLAQRQADVQDLEAKIASEQTRHQTNQNALERQKALLALAERAVAREQKLSQSNVSSAAKIDVAQQNLESTRLAYVAKQLDVQDHPHRLAQLQAQLARANASLEQTRLDLSRTRITAPFSGTITQVFISPGERVRVGDKLIEMYDTDHIEIRAQIPQRWVSVIDSAFGSGQSLHAVAQTTQASIPLSLVRLSGQVNAGSGGVDGLFRIHQSHIELTRGKTVNVVLNLPAIENVFRLPISALYGTDRIYRYVDGRLQGLTVNVVGRNLQNNQQQILFTSNELNNQDSVITTQLPNAINGLKVSTSAPSPRNEPLAKDAASGNQDRAAAATGATQS